MDQSRKDMSMQPDDVSLTKRRSMRKGTRSCTQCRKRKRRCVYPPGNAVCLPCSLRGSKCVDQRETALDADQSEHAAPHTSSRRTRRGKVQEGESLLYASVEDSQQGRSAQYTIEQVNEDLETTSGVRPPLVPVLNSGQDCDSSTSELMPSASPKAHASRRAYVCKELRSALPRYDEIVEALSQNGDWWESFRQKTRAISQAEPVEPLLSFAAHAYTSENPAVLGTLAIAYGRSLGRGNHLFALVDRLVLADFSLAATTYGMECLILLGKTYTDIGQPKRAWLTWRRGLANAQLMGLHRLMPKDQGVRQRIWWAVYHGDRFTSLLLGLPYGFNDSHLDASMLQAGSGEGSWLPNLIHQSVVVAGKVIDATISAGEKSLAKAIQLDEEMEAAYNLAPAQWWKIPSELTRSTAERDQLVTQLLIQFFFFHVKMYIYLPFITSPKTEPRNPSLSSGSKLACIEAGRQLLIRYLILRTSIEDGRFLFDCKTTDFVGFTAAVVLLMGSTNLGQSPIDRNSEESQLVIRVKSVFDLIVDRTRCQIASQCRRVLGLLLDPPQGSRPVEETKIIVPYFGTFIRSHHSADHNMTEPSGHSLGDTHPQLRTQSNVNEPLELWYAGFAMEDFTWGSSWGSSDNDNLELDGGLGFALGHDAFDFDLDQDWTLFS